MDERGALIAAVLADPDDDLPRLVFADWLDERGEADTARFLRAQIALAALPEWEPQAVALRRTRPEWDRTEALAGGLPRLAPGGGLHWIASDLFRRGFGHSVHAPQLIALRTRMPELLAEVPVERLGLYSATLDQWREFAASPWLPRIREIDFAGIGAPVEAMSALLDAPGAAGLHTLRFRSAVSAAMPEVLDRLLRSALGDRLRTLELAQAFGSDESYFEDFLEAFQVGVERLESLRFRSMGFGGVHLHRLLTSRRWERLESLAIADAEPGRDGLGFLGYPDCWPRLRSVKLEGVNVNFFSPEHIANSLRAPALTSLDISDSSMAPQSFQALAKADHLEKLTALRLRRMNCDNRGVRYLVRGKFWKNLVELDLRGNPIDARGAEHLLGRRPPPAFELLRLGGDLPEEVRGRLRDHYEGKVTFGE